MSSEKSLVLAFVGLILVGTALLYAPFSTPEPISFVDALFTATAAVTVVGMGVLDYGEDFTTLGQVVVLVLIQLGGIGIITLSSLLILIVRRRLSTGAENILGARFGSGQRVGFRSVLLTVAALAFAIELVGAALLFAFLPEQEMTGLRLWHSVFHSVSAFCNAGISLFSGGLVGFESNWGVNLTIMALVILGGFGFLNLQEISVRIWRRRLRWTEFSLLLKITIVWTVGLILLGALVLLVAEDDIAFAHLSWPEKTLAAFFHSVNTRSAGFSTVSVDEFTNFSLKVFIVLMFIGGSSGSCAGGVKITTIATLAAMVRASLRNVREPIVFNRRLSMIDERKSVVLFLSAILAIMIGVFIVFLLEGKTPPHDESSAEIIAIRLDVASAITTAGISTGLTGGLSTASKYFLVILMLIGRLGPLTIIAAWLGPRPHRPFTAPEESLPIG